MRRWVCAAGLAAVVVLAGCGGGSGGGKPAASKSPAVSKRAPVRMSKRWVPKLERVLDSGGQGVCQDPGAQECADYLDDIMSVTFDLGDAIDAAKAKTQYRSTVKQIGKMSKASDAYTADGCLGDPTAVDDGSPCFGESSTMLVGVGILEQTLPTDELGLVDNG